jgi:hypothetical protein
MVYEHVFGASPEHKSVPIRHVDASSLAFLRTDRQTNQEGSSFFYANNNFALDSSTSSQYWSTILPPIPDSYVKYLQNVTLELRAGNTTLPRVRRDADLILSLLNTGAKFQEITIKISSAEAMNGLANACFDDSTMHSSHCIVSALEHIIKSQVSQNITIQLKDAWFAINVAKHLQSVFNASYRGTKDRQLVFLHNSAIVLDLDDCECQLSGRYLDDPLQYFPSGASEASSPASELSLRDFMLLDSDDGASYSDGGFSPVTEASFSSFFQDDDKQLDSKDQYDFGADVTGEDLSDVDAEMEDLVPFEGNLMSLVVQFAPEAL